MILTIKKILQCYQTLQLLNNKTDLGGRTALNIYRNFAQVENEIKMYMPVEEKVLQKYANKDDKGNYIKENNQYVFDVSVAPTVKDELEEIQTEEIEIDIKMIPFKDLENAGLSGAQIGTIEFMLDFEND